MKMLDNLDKTSTMPLGRIAGRGCLMLALAMIVWPFDPASAVEPVLDMHGFSLETPASELRAWVAREGFEPTSTSTPRSEAYVRQNAFAGQGIGFAPAHDGLDVLFFNQRGITTSVDEVVAGIEAIYGEPRERVQTDRGYRLSYELKSPSKPGQMVWVVQRGFVGVELTSDAYHAAPASGASVLDRALALLEQWRIPLLYTIGGGIALLVLFRMLPARARSFARNGIGAALYPVLGALEFLGTRMFALIFGIILIPLFVFSGCAAMVSATEQGTSWLWLIPWGIGAILAIESRDSDEFRYVILAELVFVATIAGVFLQMYLRAA